MDELFLAISDIIREFEEKCLQLITEINDGIDQRKQERASWRRYNMPRPRQLLLDKRSKVYRCRNTC